MKWYNLSFSFPFLFYFSVLLPVFNPSAFRCAYCYFLNPARKTRPQAPRLPEFSYERRLRAESPSPGPTPRSGTDTEESPLPSGGTGKTQTQTSCKQDQPRLGLLRSELRTHWKGFVLQQRATLKQVLIMTNANPVDKYSADSYTLEEQSDIDWRNIWDQTKVNLVWNRDKKGIAKIG